jgi:hypothetical protein
MGEMMNMKRATGTIAKLSAACAFSALIVASSHARADDTTSALLDVLKAKGAITQSEYDKIKARQQAEAKDSTQKLQAAEARAREAEAKAHEAEAKANEAQAKAKSDSAASEAEVAKAKAETLTAADMAIPTKMPAKSPVEYVTVLPNCVGIRVGEVDICTKGDVSFFGVEDFPDHDRGDLPSINGGLAQHDLKDSNSVRGGLLPSSFQVSLATHQAGMDIGVYVGIYTGGNNADVGVFNANNGGAPFGLGTAGIDFRQFYGTIGTPTWGTVKIGRDIGLFGSDAILNDLTLFGVGSPGNNFAPGDTTLGRIGVGYIYADFIPQITYRTPTIGGFTGYFGVFTPLAPFAFSGDPTSAQSCLSGNSLTFNSPETGFGGAATCNGWTNSDAPMLQGKLSYVNAFTPDAKLTLSTSGLWQRQQADCSSGAIINGICNTVNSSTVSGAPLGVPVAINGVPLNADGHVDVWAVDGFAMLDVWGWNLVAYGYTGKGVGTTALMFDGIDAIGGARRSDGGYFQAAYTFQNWGFQPLTVGASWGVSHLETADANDNTQVFEQCIGNLSGGCLVRDNQSWIGFARYKLTKWVNLQAEYVATKSENQLGQTIRDNAIVAGTTFFW